MILKSERSKNAVPIKLEPALFAPPSNRFRTLRETANWTEIISFRQACKEKGLEPVA
jgi:hypothetical protein